MVSVLGLSACDTSAVFSDYDGVNLIANQPFGSVSVDGTSNWYFAPGLDQDTDSTASYDYVEFEEVDSGVYGTLPAAVSEPVYRLEVVNLFHDGTFEDVPADVAPGAPFIDPGPTSLSNPLIVDDTPVGGRPAAIDGHSLNIEADDATARLAIDLSQALLDGNFTIGEVPPSYAYHMDFRQGTTSFGMELNDNSGSFSTQLQQLISRELEDPSEFEVYAFPGSQGENPDITDAVWELPNLIEPEAGLGFFSFGGFSSEVQSNTVRTTVDNIRFVRADQNHLLRLPVPRSAAGRPDVPSGGTYTLQVWVRSDPTALGSAPNRLPARFLTAGIDARTDSTIEIDKLRSATAVGRAYVGDLADWTQLTFEIPGNGVTIGFAQQADDPVLDVVFEIGGESAVFRDAGSILLAQPELYWTSQ